MIRVGVVRGGISSEYDISLQTGQAVLSALREELSEKYIPVDILIDTEGSFHLNGLPVTSSQLRDNVDVVWNALHGFYGEDGKIQQLLEELHIPYTGSGPLSSALSMNKAHTKQAMRHLPIKTASHFMVAKYDETFDISPEEYAKTKAGEIYEKIGPPWILKPVASGSSVALYKANTMPELIDALYNMSDLDEDIIVEEYVEGREGTVGVVDNFRNERHYTFLPIEIAKPKGAIFDFTAKYGGGGAEEISPGRFTKEESAALQDAARQIHNALDLRHYSRSDFIIHPKRGIYFLEVNSLPGLTVESLIPKMIKAVGGTFSEFVDHVLMLAIKGK